MTIAQADLQRRIEALPGMDRLLPALDGLPPAFLVGGAVRDLLLGATSVDMDVAVEGAAAPVAGELARRLGGQATEHDRFGTATVRSGALTVDLAATRRERYERPGALPEVEAAPLDEDLGRRDFAINAIAVSLSPGDRGRLVDPQSGVADIESRRVRVLHDRSFVDDPTRLLRAVRYEARLGFEMDGGTEALAREAAGAGALATVSGPRVRDELLDLLAEPEVATAVARLRELELDSGLHPALAADPDLVAGAALASGETGADRVLAALAALVSAAPSDLREWLEGLHLGRDRTERVARAAAGSAAVAAALREGLPPSGLRRLLAPEPPESLALALSLGAPAEPVLRFARDLRGVRLEVTGDDLVAEGVEPSPALGRALEETLDRKLDGEISGREEELRAALESARGETARGGRAGGGGR